MSFSGLPRDIGNTRGAPGPSDRASASTWTARPHSGTRCSCFAFIRVAGTVHPTTTAARDPASPRGDYLLR